MPATPTASARAAENVAKNVAKGLGETTEALRRYPDPNADRLKAAIAGHFGIRSIPTLILFRDQIIVFMQAGAMPASALQSVIEQAKALDMDQVRKDIAERDQQAQQQ